jgi:hypothetical protein
VQAKSFLIAELYKAVLVCRLVACFFFDTGLSVDVVPCLEDGCNDQSGAAANAGEAQLRTAIASALSSIASSSSAGCWRICLNHLLCLLRGLALLLHW